MIRKKLLIVVSIIIVSLVLVITLATTSIYYLTFPKAAHDLQSGLITDRKTYLQELYQKMTSPSATLCDTIQDKNLDWLWDTAPKSMLDKIPIAENLSFVWPPPKGSRYRLTAFPYPDTGDSSLWEVRFAKGMSSLLDNTAGQITFPGWQISIYDPAEPNYNTWQNFLTKSLSSKKKTLGNQGIYSNPMYVEVTHACYAPPKRTYPTCDDGGYWLYGTVGSGVFWQTCGTPGTPGNEKPGKYLVCNNKIDAMFKLWNYAQMQTPSTLTNMMMVAGLDPAKLKTTKAEDYLYARLNGTGGGYNLMAALKSIIDASEAGRQIPKLTAWRGMEPSKAKKGWVTWIACTITFVVILLALLGGVGYSIYSAVKKRDHQKWWVSTLIVLGAILGTFLMYKILYSLEWSVVSEYMFDKFGYTTMDSALKKSGLDLKSFIFATAGIDKNYQNLPPGHYNAVANGLAQTQLFDFDLSYLTSMCKLDSVIMHAQPNKSGSWAVEILDVRNTPAAGAKSLNDLIKTLGLCGQPLDGTGRMPPLKQGPIKPSTNYVGYQPTEPCNCDEQAVEKLYNKGAGTLKKCVFCKGSLSEKVC